MSVHPKKEPAVEQTLFRLVDQLNLEMNPIAPREEAVLGNDVDDIHDPGDEAKEDIKDDCNDVAVHRIFNDAVNQNQNIEEDNNQNLRNARQSINELDVTHKISPFET
jgi:hypothetical protein